MEKQMKNAVLLIALFWLVQFGLWGQNAGVYSLGPEGDFVSFSQAISFLNNLDSIAEPGIIFEVAADAVFQEKPPAITTSGSEGAPVIFIKHGLGANPKIQATGSSAASESIIRLEGVQFYTFDGIDLENHPNTTAIEFGFHLLAGAAHNSIQNSKINLSRNNNNSKGIFAQSNSSGYCHHNSYQNLEISNLCYGVQLYGDREAYHQYESVQNCKITNVTTYGIHAPYGLNTQIQNNKIKCLNHNSQNFMGIVFGGESGSAIVSSNQIEDCVTLGSFLAIIQSSGMSIIEENIIQNISGNSHITGIQVLSGTADLRKNRVSNLENIGQNLIGIQIQANSSGSQVLGNHLYGFECSVAHNNNSYAAALELKGSNCLVANNMIHNLAHSSKQSPGTMGIRCLGQDIKLYYNSIRLAVPAFNSSSSSAVIYIQEPDAEIELINNILANYSSPGSNGKTVAIWKDSAGFGGFSSLCSHNLFWYGTPDSKHLLAYLNDVGYQSLSAYQDASNLELESFCEAPVFVDEDDLHLEPEAQSSARGNALALSLIEDDFDAQQRDAINPDIGADEVVLVLWESLAELIDFGYVCSMADITWESVGISNFSNSALSFEAGCFELQGMDADCFVISQNQLTIPALSTAYLQLGFVAQLPGPKKAILCISQAGINQHIELSAFCTLAQSMPVKANWEAGFDGWIAIDAAEASWQQGSEHSYRGSGALYAHASSSKIIHLFCDVTLPSTQPLLRLNLLSQGSASQCLSLCISQLNHNPNVNQYPLGTMINSFFYQSNQWQSCDFPIPQNFAGQTIRLILSYEAQAGDFLALDNLRLLPATQSLTAPEQVQLINLANQTILLWQEVSEANEYLVESSNQATEGFLPLQRTANNQMPITLNDAKKFFRIRAFE